DPYPRFASRRQHLLQRFLPEAVEDDLHRCDTWAADGGQRLLAGLDGHAVRAHGAVGDEPVEGVEHAVVGVDRRRRAVQLNQVERVDTEIAPRAVRPGAEVALVVVLRALLDPAAHLGGY